MVFQIDLVAKVATFLLWDVHERLRLWFFPLLVRPYMRELYLTFVLGSSVKSSQLVDLIDLLGGIDWCEVPASQACRGSRCNNFSPGLSSNASNYVWYDPLLRALVDERTVRSRASIYRVHEADLSPGFFFVEDSCVDHQVANLGNKLIVTVVSGPFIADIPMSDVPAQGFTVYLMNL